MGSNDGQHLPEQPAFHKKIPRAVLPGVAVNIVSRHPSRVAVVVVRLRLQRHDDSSSRLEVLQALDVQTGRRRNSPVKKPFWLTRLRSGTHHTRRTVSRQVADTLQVRPLCENFCGMAMVVGLVTTRRAGKPEFFMSTDMRTAHMPEFRVGGQTSASEGSGGHQVDPLGFGGDPRRIFRVATVRHSAAAQRAFSRCGESTAGKMPRGQQMNASSVRQLNDSISGKMGADAGVVLK